MVEYNMNCWFGCCPIVAAAAFCGLSGGSEGVVGSEVAAAARGRCVELAAWSCLLFVPDAEGGGGSGRFSPRRRFSSASRTIASQPSFLSFCLTK